MTWKLLVINLKALLAGMVVGAKKSKKKSKIKIVLIILLVIYCVAAFMIMFGALFQQLCAPFFSAGIGWLYFALIALMGFGLCVLTTIFTVQMLLFNAKDNELLLSMPIKPSTIVVSRILTLLLYEYLFNFMVVVPAVVVLSFSGYATVVGTVFFVLGMLLVPLPALAVSGLLGWAVSALSARMRNKNIITIVLSLGFLAAYFVLYARMQSYINQLVQNGAEIAVAVRKAAFPVYHFGIAAAEKNAVSFLLFALCAVIPFVFVCVALARGFTKIATTKRGAAKIKYKERALRASGAEMALLRIEFRRFFSNAMILMNSGIGALFMLGGAAVLIVKPSLVTDYLLQIEAMAGIEPIVVCAAAIMLLCSMITVSSCSISLEGKTLWLVKSLPVSGGAVLRTKALAHAAISGLPALFASLACLIRLDAEPLSALATILAPLSLSAAMALFGVIINLLLPKLDWINEVQAVKQSASVVVCMLVVMMIVLALVFVYIFLLMQVMDITLYLLACSALLLILSGLMYAYLMRGGSRRFAALI